MSVFHSCNYQPIACCISTELDCPPTPHKAAYLHREKYLTSGQAISHYPLFLIAFLCRKPKDTRTSSFRDWLVLYAFLVELTLGSESHNYRIPNVFFNRSALNLRLRSIIPVFDRPAADRTARALLGTLIMSPVLTGRSKHQERCDQAVVHAQWIALDRNSVIALLLLYRRRKRRRNGVQWVYPMVTGRDAFCAVYTLFDEYEPPRWRKQVFKLFSKVSFIFQRDASPIQCRNSKMRYCTQPVEILAVAIR
jgi:hypothetical protein